jgi:hypothetical protein
LSRKVCGHLGPHRGDGQTDTPDFQVAVSGHPVPLRTDFTRLSTAPTATPSRASKATVLHSSLPGKIVRMKEPQHGHDIELNVVQPRNH